MSSSGACPGGEGLEPTLSVLSCVRRLAAPVTHLASAILQQGAVLYVVVRRWMVRSPVACPKKNRLTASRLELLHHSQVNESTYSSIKRDHALEVESGSPTWPGQPSWLGCPKLSIAENHDRLATHQSVQLTAAAQSITACTCAGQLQTCGMSRPGHCPTSCQAGGPTPSHQCQLTWHPWQKRRWVLVTARQPQVSLDCFIALPVLVWQWSKVFRPVTSYCKVSLIVRPCISGAKLGWHICMPASAPLLEGRPGSPRC